MSYIYSGKVRFPQSVQPLMTPLDQVKQFTNNPNNADLDAIVESIRANGFTTVITVDANTRQIVAGNHRWQALHALGATEAPMMFVDYGTEEEAKRILVADNRTGQLARPDEAMLLDILKELKDTDLGLEGTGYDDHSYSDLLLEVESEPTLDPGFDAGPALYGIYETVVAFETEQDRDEFYQNMVNTYGEENVRTVNV